MTDTNFTFDPKADYYEFFEASMADPILEELMDDCEDYDEFSACCVMVVIRLTMKLRSTRRSTRSWSITSIRSVPSITAGSTLISVLLLLSGLQAN